jgi:2-polyprenyl-3-methyl-5-hydroxy-6-metoxy-1,4-benzoquinol methylase
LYFRSQKQIGGFLLSECTQSALFKYPITIFGAGSGGYILRSLLLKHNFEVRGYADNNAAYWNNRLGGLYVSEPSKRVFSATIPIVAVPLNALWQVKSQLFRLGICDFGVFFEWAYPFSESDKYGRIVLDVINEIINLYFKNVEEIIQNMSSDTQYLTLVGNLLNAAGWTESISEYFDKCISDDGANKTLLDIGPGEGLLSKVAKKLKPELVIDWLSLSSSKSVYKGFSENEANGKNLFPRSHYFGIVENPDFSVPVTYDYIVLTEVFEHFASNPVSVMRNIKKFLNPQGFMFFSTPDWGRIPIYSNYREMPEYAEINNEFDKWLFGHTYQYSQSELFEIFKQSGFQVLHYSRNLSGHHQIVLKPESAA